MTLPPDFWTKPQPGGLSGLLFGLIIGVAMWCYFVLPAYWKTKWPSAANMGFMLLLGPMMIGCALLGSIIGALTALEFGH